jgi:hypothetical protein
VSWLMIARSIHVSVSIYWNGTLETQKCIARVDLPWRTERRVTKVVERVPLPQRAWTFRQGRNGSASREGRSATRPSASAETEKLSPSVPQSLVTAVPAQVRVSRSLRKQTPVVRGFPSSHPIRGHVRLCGQPPQIKSAGQSSSSVRDGPHKGPSPEEGRNRKPGLRPCTGIGAQWRCGKSPVLKE